MVAIRLLLLHLCHKTGLTLGLRFALSVLQGYYYSNHLYGPESKFSYAGIRYYYFIASKASGRLR